MYLRVNIEHYLEELSVILFYLYLKTFLTLKSYFKPTVVIIYYLDETTSHNFFRLLQKPECFH